MDSPTVDGNMMGPVLTVLRHRREGESEAEALEQHRARAKAVRAALDAVPYWSVKSWDALEGDEPFLAVRLQVDFQPNVVCPEPVPESVAYFAERVAQHTSESGTECFQLLLIRLHDAQMSGGLECFEVHYANGDIVVVDGEADGWRMRYRRVGEGTATTAYYQRRG